MNLTTRQAKEIREGILVARRNYVNNLGLDYDAQVPRGKLRQKAFARTWVKWATLGHAYPPKASSTRWNRKQHGPTVEEMIAGLKAGKTVRNESIPIL